MDCSDLTRELKKHTELMDYTFTKHNFKVLNYSYVQWNSETADAFLIVEIASTDIIDLDHNLRICVNLYNESGDIICNKEGYILVDEFEGYDTIRVLLQYNGRALIEAKTARVYMAYM